MRQIKAALALAGFTLLGQPAHAQLPAPAEAILDGMGRCRAIADLPARAACYDAAYDRLKGSVGLSDVVIVEKKQVQAAQRQAFGLSLPSLSVFDRATGQGPIDSISGEVVDARRDERGRWVVTLAEGAVWRQIDDDPMRAPRRGAPVEVRRAALGSFMMKVDGQRGVRVRREN
jgi:hypothetical protein